MKRQDTEDFAPVHGLPDRAHTAVPACLLLPSCGPHSYSSENVQPEFALYPYIIPQTGAFETEPVFPCLLCPAQSETGADSPEIMSAISFQGEKKCFDQEPGRKQRQIQKKLKGRHIFIDQIDTVSGGVTDL